MSSDVEYLSNYQPKTLYVLPGRDGAYAKLVAQNEIPLNEIEVTQRSRIAVSAFYVNDKNDYDTFKITKLKFHKTYGWQEDGHVHINRFELAKMRSFISILASLDLRNTGKVRVSLGEVQIESLAALLESDKGSELIRELSAAPELYEDIYAIAAKRRALDQFETNLGQHVDESEWQAFFEANTWIFGHGLNYVFLDKVAKKLEAATSGSTFDKAGKRADGLMRTRAEISQYVLVEIKRSGTDLLQRREYRPGCWAVSEDLSNAVTQIQKTVHEFTRNRFRDHLKDASGNNLAAEVYSIEPRSYLVIGNLAEVLGNDDKVTCFELYRRNVRAPEILTFDELHQRSRCIVENISRKIQHTSTPGEIS